MLALEHIMLGGMSKHIMLGGMCNVNTPHLLTLRLDHIMLWGYV